MCLGQATVRSSTQLQTKTELLTESSALPSVGWLSTNIARLCILLKVKPNDIRKRSYEMNLYLLAVSGLMSFLPMAVIFIIIFVTIKASLNHSSLFGNKVTVLVAVCVTILCLIGMNDYLIFLPFAALGTTLLLLPLVFLFTGTFSKGKLKDLGKEGRTSKEGTDTKESDFRKRLKES